jgi:hypothetical protein
VRESLFPTAGKGTKAYRILDNCSCIVLIPSIHGHMLSPLTDIYVSKRAAPFGEGGEKSIAFEIEVSTALVDCLTKQPA